MFCRLPARAVSVAHTNLVCGTQKNVSDFVQKHFMAATNVPWFAQDRNNIHFVSRAFARPRNIISNNVSLFARALASYSVRALDILMFDVVRACLINCVRSSDTQ